MTEMEKNPPPYDSANVSHRQESKNAYEQVNIPKGRNSWQKQGDWMKEKRSWMKKKIELWLTSLKGIVQKAGRYRLRNPFYFVDPDEKTHRARMREYLDMLEAIEPHDSIDNSP